MLFSIGDEIRKVRKQRKITQAVIAKALGMSRSTISQIESGIVQDVGVRKLIRILDYLGLELKVQPTGAPPTLEDLQRENEGIWMEERRSKL
jgi:transcriptional regulator with XRE-family HTH domain